MKHNKLDPDADELTEELTASVGIPGHGYTQDVIDEMKTLGLPKPEEVSWGEWVGPKDLSHRHDLLIQLAAGGATNNQIAEELGMTPGRISIILQRPEVKAKIKAQQEKLYGKRHRERLQALANKSIERLEQVLDNEQEPSKLKVDVAQYVLDQSIGKAKQDLEVKGNLLAELLIQIEQAKSRDITPAAEKLAKPADPIDNLADGLITNENFTVGKRNEESE